MDDFVAGEAATNRQLPGDHPAPLTSNTSAGQSARSSTEALGLHSWRSRQVLAVAVAALMAGFGQFGIIAALGEVATHFGQAHQSPTLAEQAGLSGTALGIGLAVIRLAGVLGLPLASRADRIGRRPLLLIAVAGGLAGTAVSALSPTYWWFVVIFALGRPLLSATNALAQVCAAELTSAADRTGAVALTTAGYGLGAGLIAVIHTTTGGALGFRAFMALAVAPLLMMPWLKRHLPETERFANQMAPAQVRNGPSTQRSGTDAAPLWAGHGWTSVLRSPYRSRWTLVVILTFAVSVITGPATSFVFLYAQNTLRIGGAITTTMVLMAGISGLVGLLVGRTAADRLGRRPTAAAAMAGLGAFSCLTYAGSTFALVTGYVLGILAAGCLGTAAGALVNELFPTSIRASVAGWCLTAGVLGAMTGLIVFGSITDTGHGFSAAALVTFTPAISIMGLFWMLPETKGREPEQMLIGTA